MRVAIALLLLGITPAYLKAQSVDSHTVVFSGYVKDQTGASIPKATLSFEANKKPVLETAADAAGHFSIETKPGEYTLKVASRGFATYMESIDLVGITPIVKDIVLRVGSCSPCTVVERPPPIELLSASLTYTLPLNPLPPLKLHRRRRNPHKTPAISQAVADPTGATTESRREVVLSYSKDSCSSIGPCVQPGPLLKWKHLNTPITATLPLKPLPPFKLCTKSLKNLQQ